MHFVLHKYNTEQVISSGNTYGKLEKYWEGGADVAYFEVLYQHLLGGALHNSSVQIAHASDVASTR
jgi:hypothetical protein